MTLIRESLSPLTTKSRVIDDVQSDTLAFSSHNMTVIMLLICFAPSAEEAASSLVGVCTTCRYRNLAGAAEGWAQFPRA